MMNLSNSLVNNIDPDSIGFEGRGMYTYFARAVDAMSSNLDYPTSKLASVLGASVGGWCNVNDEDSLDLARACVEVAIAFYSGNATELDWWLVVLGGACAGTFTVAGGLNEWRGDYQYHITFQRDGSDRVSHMYS